MFNKILVYFFICIIKIGGIPQIQIVMLNLTEITYMEVQNYKQTIINLYFKYFNNR